MPFDFVSTIENLDIVKDIADGVDAATTAINTATSSYIATALDAASTAANVAVATIPISPTDLEKAITQARAAGELASSVGEVVTDLACGQDGIFTQVKQIQTFVQQQIMVGRNFYNNVLDTIDQVQDVIEQLKEPDLLISLLQQEALNIVSKTVLENPEDALQSILELRAAYQSAGPAAERIIDNLEQFIKDPLNTPLDVCNDIPNLVKIGETFVEFPRKALQADPSKTLENVKETVIKEYETIFDNPTTVSEELLEEQSEQTIPTASKYPLPDIQNDIAVSACVPGGVTLGPGAANRAAYAKASGDMSSMASMPPPPSLANPFPEGRQFTAQDFAPSKYARNIASKINSLHPSVRGRFAAGIQDYIKNNYPTRDINVTEGYRSPARSAQLAASGIRAAPAGKSWHNYGAAMDIAIYVNGKYDDGRRGVTEYTGLARQSMQKYGLANDLRGDTGHVYVSAFGKGVPKAVQQKQTTIAQLAGQNGLAPVPTESPATAIAQAGVTQDGNTTVIDVSGVQREARNKAISDALAQGKSIQEAERLGAIAGNNAGTEALKNLT